MSGQKNTRDTDRPSANPLAPDGLLSSRLGPKIPAFGPRVLQNALLSPTLQKLAASSRQLRCEADPELSTIRLQRQKIDKVQRRGLTS